MQPDNGQPTTTRTLNQWLKAFILAIGVLIVIHLFVLRFVTVKSTSMFATLLPGDLVLVQRWAIHTGLDRGDVVVFRDPLKDRQHEMRRPLLVKRIAGMPGDLLELRGGDLYINGDQVDPPAHATWSHLLQMEPGASPDSLLGTLGIPTGMAAGNDRYEVPLNDTLASLLKRSATVKNVRTSGTKASAPLFPFSPNFPWTGRDLGPLRIPAKGDTIAITPYNLPLYDRLIGIYEGHRLSNSGDRLLIDGLPLDRYIVEQDHYFMLGDSRDHSADSRYWGFVPHDHLVGRAVLVIVSKGPGGLRDQRFFETL